MLALCEPGPYGYVLATFHQPEKRRPSPERPEVLGTIATLHQPG